MTGLDDRLSVHAAVLHPPRLSGWLAQARDRDQRLTTAARVINMVSASDPGTIIAFPAGFLRAGRIDVVHELAEHMLALARQSQVAVAFGIELGDDDEGKWPPIEVPPRAFAYVCDGGRRIMWPTARDDVAYQVRGHRIGVLVGREVFRRELRARVLKPPPAAILALTNLGPTGRWRQVLRRLGETAPTIVVGESLTGGVPEWADAPDGWRRDRIAGDGGFTVVRYEPTVTPAGLQPALLRDVGARPASMKD